LPITSARLSDWFNRRRPDPAESVRPRHCRTRRRCHL